MNTNRVFLVAGLGFVVLLAAALGEWTMFFVMLAGLAYVVKLTSEP